jgi:hypothetical protein
LGEKEVVVSLEEAIIILSKWKDDSATVLVAAESPFRLHFRGIHDPWVDWTMGIRVRVAQAEFSPGTKGGKAGIVVFERSSGDFRVTSAISRFFPGFLAFNRVAGLHPVPLGAILPPTVNHFDNNRNKATEAREVFIVPEQRLRSQAVVLVLQPGG